MEPIDAFVGHSFLDEDRGLVSSFLDQFERINKLNPNFKWEHAKEAETKELADKVAARMSDKNLYIAICTKKVAFIPDTHLDKVLTGKKKVTAKLLKWKTSDWIIQEIGFALGREMRLILLIEAGLESPGEFQGNYEHIIFDRKNPEKAFSKIEEMITNIISIPAEKPTGMVGKEVQTIPPEEVKEETPTEERLTPDSSWDQETYEKALFRSFLYHDVEGEIEIYDAYLKSDLGCSSPNCETWEAYYECLRIIQKRGSWTKLTQLAKQHPYNPRIQKYLAQSYESVGEHEMAAPCYKIAAQNAPADREKMDYYAKAAINYAKVGEALEVESLVGELKNIAPKVEQGNLLLTGSMRTISANLEDKDALCGLAERLLELDPGDLDARFELAYKYSGEGKDELALFHYKKIPFQQRHPVVWNNLGVAFEILGMPGKSVNAYNFAIDKGGTLASSNLSAKLLKVGFLSEAEKLCQEAMKKTDCHENAVHCLSDIKKIPIREAEEESKCINKAAPISNFYRQYGEALTAQPFLKKDASEWQGPKCKLYVEISEGKIIARGSYEIPGALALLSPVRNLVHSLGKITPKKEQCEVIYEGEMKGRTFKGSLRKSWGHNSGGSLASSDKRIEETEFLMVLSEALDEIRVYEKKDDQIYSFRRDTQTETEPLGG